MRNWIGLCTSSYQTCIYSGDHRKNHFMKLKYSPYGLEDAVLIWHGLLATISGQAGLKELHSAPCIFKSEGMIVLGYVNDMVVFSKYKSQIDEVK